MRTFFLTLDLEEWYHLEYLKDGVDTDSTRVIEHLDEFFQILKKNNIKITVFVLGELIDRHQNLIQSFVDEGHEIGIHGWNHQLLGEKSLKTFVNEISATKNKLESTFGCDVIGYRAPCFSMSNEKLEALKGIGLEYDSSFIQFKDHPLYGDLNMNESIIVDNLVYKKNGVYEFELPTISLFGKMIPISGGGYFRLFPKFIFKRLWRRYIDENQNFNMYIHPFELTDVKVDIGNVSRGKRFRFGVGRRGNLKKLEWFIQMAKKDGFRFHTIKEYVEFLV